eukprot:SAG11_NODE_201_length_12551_cov_67.866126_7_plen_169_part_00
MFRLATRTLGHVNRGVAASSLSVAAPVARYSGTRAVMLSSAAVGAAAFGAATVASCEWPSPKLESPINAMSGKGGSVKHTWALDAISTVLWEHDDITAMVQRLGREITADYKASSVRQVHTRAHPQAHVHAHAHAHAHMPPSCPLLDVSGAARSAKVSSWLALLRTRI